jgi:hypothetical protein
MKSFMINTTVGAGAGAGSGTTNLLWLLATQATQNLLALNSTMISYDG